MTTAYGIVGILDCISILPKMDIAWNMRSNSNTGFILYQIIFRKDPRTEQNTLVTQLKTEPLTLKHFILEPPIQKETIIQTTKENLTKAKKQ